MQLPSVIRVVLSNMPHPHKKSRFMRTFFICVMVRSIEPPSVAQHQVYFYISALGACPLSKIAYFKI